MASNEETNAAGTDTRPPMLVESDYESWKIRIHSYCDSAALPAPRKKLDSEFIEEENKHRWLILKREIILSIKRKAPGIMGNTVLEAKGDILQAAREKDMLLGSVKKEEKRGLSVLPKIKALLMEAKEKVDV
ncbi:hypothetical protein Tco_1437081 [Tanacetum coccineum]